MYFCKILFFAILFIFVSIPAIASDESVDDNTNAIYIDGELGEDVIFDGDNRLFLSETKLKTKAKSIAAIVRATHVKVGQLTPIGNSVGDLFGLCKNEDFYDEPALAQCTGTLVAPDVLLTAGHCVVSKAHCKTLKFVFNVSDSNAKKNPLKPVSKEIYSCNNVIYRSDNSKNLKDIALIRLNKNVTGRTFLPMNFLEKKSKGTSLHSIGHSEGMELTVSPVGSIQGYYEQTFMHDLDVFGGNSGAPIFVNGSIVGIHTKRAFDHYIYNSSQKCYIRQAVAGDPARYGRAPEEFWAKGTYTQSLKSTLNTKKVVLAAKIDKIKKQGTNRIIEGWACALTRKKSITVKVKDAKGQFVKKTVASLKLSQTDEKYCQSGVSHNFRVKIAKQDPVTLDFILGTNKLSLKANTR